MKTLSYKRIQLPSPSTKGSISLEEALVHRRSVREFQERELTLEEISQLLWAAQGITHPAFGLRTAPSAGALYPLEVYAANGDGVFHYLPQENTLVQQVAEDVRCQLRAAAGEQESLKEAPCVFVITGVEGRITIKFGQRGIRYSKMEEGHSTQNLLLQAVALRLAGVPIGAFSDREVAQILRLRKGERPLYLIPVGQPQNSNPN